MTWDQIGSRPEIAAAPGSPHHPRAVPSRPTRVPAGSRPHSRKVFVEEPAGNLVGPDAQETTPLDALVVPLLVQPLNRQALASKNPELRDAQSRVNACPVCLRD